MKHILQIDDEQRGRRPDQRVESMQLAARLRNAVDDVLRNVDLMHRASLLFILFPSSRGHEVTVAIQWLPLDCFASLAMTA